MEEKMNSETGENMVVGASWALFISIPIWFGILFGVYKLFFSL